MKKNNIYLAHTIKDKDEKGAAIIEYILIGALIASALVATLLILSDTVRNYIFRFYTFLQGK